MEDDIQIEAFALKAAVEALIAGDAVVSDDGREIRWEEPDHGMDRLVGIFRCEDGYRWSPIVEMTTARN